MRSFTKFITITSIQRRRYVSVFTTTTEVTEGNGASDKASKVLTPAPAAVSPSQATATFSSKLREATEGKDERLYRSGGPSPSLGFSEESTGTGQDEVRKAFDALKTVHNTEKPFNRRLEDSLTRILATQSQASATISEANLEMSEIKVAAVVVNLKSTLQSNFPISLSAPISANHLAHITSVLADVHLNALRPMHSFTLINQREQEMPAFNLLDEAASSGRTFIKLVVAIETAIVDEEFCLTTVKVHSDKDEAGLTLLWLTMLHKMDLNVL